MQLVERHIVKNSKAMEDLCFNAARLYNFVNYHKRQAFFGKQENFGEYEMDKLCAEFNQEDFRRLPAQTSQQVVGQVFDAWKSFWASLKEWKKNPSKFMGKPKAPKYKDKDGCGVASFTNQQCKLKDGHIGFPKSVGISPIKTNVDNVCQVRIVPQATCFVVEIIYEKQIITHENINPENVMAIDPGLNNLLTSIDNVGNRPFIVNGRGLKSINNFYNKQKAKFQSYIGDRGTSNRIDKLTQKRNNKINNALHQTSSFVVKNCIGNNIGTVAIGKNERWKTGIHLGKKTNQQFVGIPHARLITMIEYKLKLHGINCIVHEESYTSKCDHLAFEEMKHHEKYSGKRIKRGLFKSAIGKCLNADVNGALGIGLKSKVFRDGKKFIHDLLDIGLAFNPVKFNIQTI